MLSDQGLGFFTSKMNFLCKQLALSMCLFPDNSTLNIEKNVEHIVETYEAPVTPRLAENRKFYFGLAFDQYLNIILHLNPGRHNHVIHVQLLVSILYKLRILDVRAFLFWTKEFDYLAACIVWRYANVLFQVDEPKVGENHHKYITETLCKLCTRLSVIEGHPAHLKLKLVSDIGDMILLLVRVGNKL